MLWDLPFAFCLVSLGLCLPQLRNLFWLEDIVLAKDSKESEKQDLCASFGLCGSLGMTLYLVMNFFYSKVEVFFVHLLWLETKACWVEDLPTLVHFIDWLGS